MRKVLAQIVAYVPLGFLRVFLYSKLFSYELHNVSIGYGTYINVRKLIARNSYIGRFNRFRGPVTVILRDGVKIADGNKFIAGEWASEFNKEEIKFIAERSVNITSDHYFDLNGGMVIGEETWVAGRGSQFWTHGAGMAPEPIDIGARCYIGSASRFVQGVVIGDGNLIGIGSVVNKCFKSNSNLIVGVPASIKRKL